jgi:FkbM family methyltransferase
VKNHRVKGYLLDGEVELDKETARCGQGWTDCDAEVYADSPVLGFFWDKVSQLSHPNVVDVGAGTGRFSLLSILHEDMSVVAFEPHPKRFALLKSNIKLNKLDKRVWVYRSALSYHRRAAPMYVPLPEYQAGEGTIGTSPPFKERCYVVRVGVRRLDDALDSFDQVDIIKASVNGAEKWVLLGAIRTLSLWIPDMLVRYRVDHCAQCRYDREDIKVLLTSWGYHCTEPVKDWLWCEYVGRNGRAN